MCFLKLNPKSCSAWFLYLLLHCFFIVSLTEKNCNVLLKLDFFRYKDTSGIKSLYSEKKEGHSLYYIMYLMLVSLVCSARETILGCIEYG